MAVEQQLRQNNALIIGGGPVARVIGKHLADAGVNISLYLKPKYAGVSNQGFAIYPTATKGKRINARWDDFRIYTTPEQLRELHADQVYVCVGQHQLRDGWLEQIWPSFRHALWVFVQPGLDDYAYIAKTVPERFIVQAKLGFLAYQAPIGDEELITPGAAYWTPPGGVNLFKGIDDEATVLVTNLLAKGGLNCQLSSDFHAERLYSTALLLPFLLSLEARGWSFERLRSDKIAIARLCVAVHELARAVYAQTGSSSKLAGRLGKPWVWRLFLKYGERYAPIPLEAYYKAQYTKLREQTENLLHQYAALLTRHRIQPVALMDLRRDWLAMRPRLLDVGHDDPQPSSNFGGIGQAGDTGSRRALGAGQPLPDASQSGQFQQPMRAGSSGQFPIQGQGQPADQQRGFPGTPRHPATDGLGADRTRPPHKSWPDGQ